MSPEELANPALMSEDLSNAEAKCPRVQRLSLESGVSEKDVALFVAEFEAMRQVQRTCPACVHVYFVNHKPHNRFLT
jgi:hypothetical protein